MTYHHGNLKQHLVSIAHHWIDRNGIDSISLRKIAKIANVSQTAPYRHFKSKEHLLADVATLGFLNFSNAMDQNAVTANPVEDLVKCGITYINFGLTNEYIMELMFNYPIKKSDFPDLMIAADNAFGALQSRIKRLDQGNTYATQLNSASIHAYTHGLLNIIQMNERIGQSGQSNFYKTSSKIKSNLEKMLSDFIKGMDFL